MKILLLILFIFSVNAKIIYKNKTFILNNESKRYNYRHWEQVNIYTNDTLSLKYRFDGFKPKYKTIEANTTWNIREGLLNDDFVGIKLTCENICEGYVYIKKDKYADRAGKIFLIVFFSIFFGGIILFCCCGILYNCVFCFYDEMKYIKEKEKYKKFFRKELFYTLRNKVKEKYLVDIIYQYADINKRLKDECNYLV